MKKGPKYIMWLVLATFALTVAVSYNLPPHTSNYGIFSAIPALLLIVYVILTKRVIIGIVFGIISGVIMISRPETMGHGEWAYNVFDNFSRILMETLTSEDTQWLVVVCGSLGCIIRLIEKSGGAKALCDWISERIRSGKAAMLWTWALGVVIFIDDYFSSLVLGTCMTPVSDKYKVPREYLAYVTQSTAAPICALIPLSSWGIFVSRVLESNNAVPEGEGLLMYLQSIPYNFYPLVTFFITPLVVLGIIPMFGPMKKALKRVNEGGPLAPPNSEKFDIHVNETPKKSSMLYIILPVLVLVLSTIILDADMEKGVLCTFVFMFIYYSLKKVMTADEFVDNCIDGFCSMILALLIVILDFFFARINSEIYFTGYVINNIALIASPEMLPCILFVSLACTEYVIGSNWGMYVIALPIAVPLAIAIDANLMLSISAVLSAGVLGAHLCAYSDSTVITSTATGCETVSHAATQLPFGIVAAVISALLFLVAGYIL